MVPIVPLYAYIYIHPSVYSFTFQILVSYFGIEERKVKRLQQNRVSALKCRKKKKELFEVLVQERDELKDENQLLTQRMQEFEHLLTQKEKEKQLLEEKILMLEKGSLANTPSQQKLCVLPTYAPNQVINSMNSLSDRVVFPNTSPLNPVPRTTGFMSQANGTPRSSFRGKSTY